MDTDFLLIQKMRMGDERALESFVKKYYPQILKYCRVHISEAGYAEDMAQETFARFFGALKQYKHYGKVRNYLYVIASNTCIDYQRKTKEIPLEQMSERMSMATDHVDVQVDVRIALSQMPAEIREVAVLYFIQEQKQKDIARILGISLSLTKYRISRARELLTAYLGKENV